MQLKTSRIFTILLSLALVLTLGTATLNAQQLYYHNFGATTITTHPYVAAPVTIHANFSNSNWTNSKNAWTSGVGAPPGQGIQVSTSTGTTNIYLKFTVTPNYQATITSFNFWRIRSNSGPQDWKLLVNGTEVGSGSVPTAGSAVGQTALATPVTVGGNVTVELVLTNATGGWFRLDDFTLNGTVASTCNSISVSSFSPATGPAGTKVKITGSGFTGASDVKFNGISAPNYTVISNTEIEAIIPPGGTTGKVDVFDALGCNGSSAVNYQVLTSLCSTPQAPVPDLFISEVYDQKSGSGGMIELYNPTSATITFNGQYRLLRYGDIGDTTPTAGYNLVLPGSIGPKSTYLLYGTAPLQSICATPSSSVQFGNGFNGNDKFELLKGGNVIDVAHITSTAAGFTTRRKPTVIAPKNVFNSADWDIIVHGSDPDPSYCDDLGVFNLPVPPNVTPIPVRTICAGSNTTFTATLSNTAGYTYQWKTLNSSGAWVNVTNGGNFSGATTATLTVSSAVIALNDTQYYCEMTSLNCNVKSSASQLYVIDITPPVLSQTAPTCTVATGSITVNPVTGATYSKDNNAFQSSNVFNSLSPGTYTITIKVGTCTASNTITINPTPTGPSAPTAQEVPATCTTPGGISVDPVAGMEYSIGTSSGYQASNTFSNVPAGTYNVTVKNSAGCISAVTQVTVNPAPSAAAAPTAQEVPATCTTPAGISVDPVAGMEYSIGTSSGYQASNTFSNVPAGTYNVTVKNSAGCISAVTQVTVNPAPSAPAAPTAQEVPATCTTPAGITIDPVAGMEYSIGTSSGYQTSNTFNNVPAGTYNVTVKNSAGCISPVTQVTVNPAPSAPAAPTAQEVPATCTTPAGITIDPVAGMEYSIGTSSGYQTSNTFNNVPAGTYNVTVKNSAGCISAVTQITVNPAPSAPAAPTAQEVPATCTTPAGISIDPVAGMEYSIGTSSGYQTSNTFSNVPAGTYNITVKNSAGCISAVTQITVNPAPTAPQITNITEAHPTCLTSFGKITVIATGTGLEYSIQSLRPFQSSNEFSNVPPGNYQITIRNAAGCEDFGNSVINPVPAAPSQPVAIPTQATCLVTSAKITVTPVAGSGITYQLNGGTPQASNEFTNVPAGTYIVTVINAEGCDNVSDPVTINPIPTAPARPVATQAPATCSTSASITVTPVAGMEYSIGSGYQTSNIFNNVPAGTYNVTVRNTAGCISPALQIVVAPAPTAPARPVATQTPATCSTPASITVTPVAGMEYSISSGYQASNVFNNVTAGTYNVTVRNSAGCISPALQITVAPAPTAPARPVATQTPATCSTSASITVTPVAGMQYSIGSGYQSSNIFNNVPAGTYNVTVRNTAGCISPALQIVVAPAPTAPARPVATQTPATCSTSESITVTPVAGMEYSIGSGYQASNVFNNVPAGTYNVTVRNASGCISPALQITVAPAPTAPARPVATQTPATCSTLAIIIVTPVAGMEYSIGSGYQTLNIFNNVPAGTYNVTVRNTAGCISPAFQIIVAPAPTQPVAAPITGNSNICDGNTLQLTITTTGGTWKSNDSAIATINQNGTVTALNAGTVTITYEIPGPCPATSSKTITVHPKPKSGLLPRYYLCTDNAGRAIPVFLYSGINEPGYVFVWRKENTTLTANTSSIVATDPGIYSVTATNTLTGCSVTASTMVGISSIASATASVGFEFENYQTIRVNVTGGSGDYEYSLDGEEWQDEPYFIGHFEGDYTVRIKDKNGCGTAKVEVVALNYPRFFTPNGDGVNDTWNIKGMFWQNTKIYIYDRYGKLITEVRPGVLGWDGTYNGHRLPATDYWFTMKYKSRSGDEKELKAHFALKR